MHVEDIHISYVRHFLKDDGTFNEFDDISQFYMQVDDIHSMYARQLLKSAVDEKKLDYIEPFCVINVDENEANALKNRCADASLLTLDVPQENDGLSTVVDGVDGLTDAVDRKRVDEESVETAQTSHHETVSDEDAEIDGEDADDDDDEYEGVSDSSEEHKAFATTEVQQTYPKKRPKVSQGSDGGRGNSKKHALLKAGIEANSGDERSVLLLKYVQLKCDLCSEREFRSFSDVQRHFWAEHEQNGYVRCCNRKFRRLARILQHCQWHENPEAFK